MKYILLALLKNLFVRADVIYISEGASWVIKDIGQSLMRVVKKMNLKMSMSYHALLLKKPIVHFGSIHTCFVKGQVQTPPKNAKWIATWYHVEPNDKRLKLAGDINNALSKLQVTHQEMKQRLMAAGIDEDKLVVIPMGINTAAYTPADVSLKQSIRTRLGIPANATVIGSFQKDGSGWGEGLEPKLIKGPDIFCDVIANLKDKHSLHVLLTGPARGYVKKRLDDMGVSYTHHFLDKATDVITYYQALDLYIIAARAEGGPLAILESWATGTPIVSTKVGIVQDIATNKQNTLLSEVEDVTSLSANAHQLLTDKQLQQQCISNGLETVKQYDWEILVNRFYKELYEPLLNR